MLEFHGKMLVKNFKQAMLDTFGLRIKVHQGFSMGQTADDSATLAATRSGVADSTSATIALTQLMTVEQAEAAIRAAAGFAVQVLDASGANAPNDARLVSLGFRATPPPAVGSSSASSGSGTSVSVTGQKRLATIQSEFTERFAQLGLMFFSLEEAKKADQGIHIQPLPSDQTVASVRTKTAKGDMSIHGSTTVGSLEANFRDDYGLFVQVCYMREGKPVYTGSGLDGATLSELNRRAAEQGRGTFAYPKR
jgi:hypothetical protein